MDGLAAVALITWKNYTLCAGITTTDLDLRPVLPRSCGEHQARRLREF